MKNNMLTTLKAMVKLMRPSGLGQVKGCTILHNRSMKENGNISDKMNPVILYIRKGSHR